MGDSDTEVHLEGVAIQRQSLQEADRQELARLIQQTEREKAELNKLVREKQAEIDRLSEQRPSAASTNPKPDFSTPSSGAQPPSLQNSMSPISETTIHQLLQLSRQQYQSQVDSMRLPPADLIKFDGEPLKYWQFMRLFSTIVDKETVSDEEKLTRLHQYTVGKARDAIAHCLYSPDPSRGFRDAMSTLKRRFGSPYTISTFPSVGRQSAELQGH